MPSELHDNSAGQNAELDAASFEEIAAAPEVVAGRVNHGRRNFLKALAAGAVFGASDQVLGGDPATKVAANTSVKTTAASKLSPEQKLELIRKEWATRHMNDDEKTWKQTRFNEITQAPEDRDRELENLYLAAIANPEGYKIVYPNEVDKSLPLGPEGRASRRVKSRMVVFAILKRENGKLSKIPGKTNWGALGLAEVVSKDDPGNPGIYSSRTLANFSKEGAQQAVKFAEEVMKHSDDSVASNK